MKYRKSDLLAIIVIIAFIVLMFVLPHNENNKMILAILVVGAILMTVMLKLFYFEKDKYVSSRKRKAMEEKARQLGQIDQQEQNRQE